MKPYVMAAVLGFALVLGGCASVTGTNSQKMSVETSTADGQKVLDAECSLSNDKGTWQIKTPGETTIVRSNKLINIKCVKPPLPQGRVDVDSDTRSAMFGNILIGGIVGAVIDHSSGAAYEYPEIIQVVMGKTLFAKLPDSKPGASNTSNARTVAVYSAPGAPKPTAAAGQAPGVQTGPAPVPVNFIATGFADVNDVDAIPYLGDRGRESYRGWLTRPTPKAFAIAPNGVFAASWGLRGRDPSDSTDPTERVVAVCSRSATMPCKLYAVNGSVVWVKDSSASGASAASAKSSAATTPLQTPPGGALTSATPATSAPTPPASPAQ
jgi:hypothetical protein